MVDKLCPCLGKDGVIVSTVEHLMAALYGLGVDNLMIDLDGGNSDSRWFVPRLGRSFARARLLSSVEAVVVVRRPVGASAMRLPAGRAADFFTASIDSVVRDLLQTYSFDFGATGFVEEISARTFAFKREVDFLLSRFGSGWKLNNAIVLMISAY